MDAHLDYRPLEGEQDVAAFARVLDRSFAIPRRYTEVLLRRLGPDVRVLADERGVAACLGWYACGQWLGRRSLRTAGIAAVGVEPHRRGEKLATRLTLAALEELAGSGFALATLYPSTLGLYRGVGFETSGGRYELRIPCRALPRERCEDAVVELPLGIADERVRACHARVATGRNGWMDRNDALWDRVREWKTEVREGFGVVRGGEIAGYVFLARRQRRDGRYDLVCGDLVAEDMGAARALLAFLGSHATLAVDAIAWLTPWDPIVAALPDVTWKIAHQYPWMVRVLDVRTALTGRGWDAHRAGELHLEIADELLPHNRGRFVLEVEGGAATVRAGGDGRVQVDARALGPWLTGHQSAEALAFADLVRGAPRDLAWMSALTAGPAPTMPDFF